MGELLILLNPHLFIQAFQSSEICSAFSGILAPDTFTHKEPFSVDEVTTAPCWLSLHNVPEGDLFPPQDPPRGSDLDTEARLLDRPRVSEAGVVEIGEKRIETHQLPVLRPEVNSETVHAHYPYHPLNLSFTISFLKLTNIPITNMITFNQVYGSKCQESPDKLDTMLLLIIPHFPIVFPSLITVTEKILEHSPALWIPPSQADAPQREDGGVVIIHKVELLHLSLEVCLSEDLTLHGVHVAISALGVTHGEVAASALKGTINPPVK